MAYNPMNQFNTAAPFEVAGRVTDRAAAFAAEQQQAKQAEQAMRMQAHSRAMEFAQQDKETAAKLKMEADKQRKLAEGFGMPRDVASTMGLGELTGYNESKIGEFARAADEQRTKAYTAQVEAQTKKAAVYGQLTDKQLLDIYQKASKADGLGGVANAELAEEVKGIMQKRGMMFGGAPAEAAAAPGDGTLVGVNAPNSPVWPKGKAPVAAGGKPPADGGYAEAPASTAGDWLKSILGKFGVGDKAQ